jgi:hypothetical protein
MIQENIRVNDKESGTLGEWLLQREKSVHTYRANEYKYATAHLHLNILIGDLNNLCNSGMNILYVGIYPIAYWHIRFNG